VSTFNLGWFRSFVEICDSSDEAPIAREASFDSIEALITKTSGLRRDPRVRKFTHCASHRFAARPMSEKLAELVRPSSKLCQCRARREWSPPRRRSDVRAFDEHDLVSIADLVERKGERGQWKMVGMRTCHRDERRGKYSKRILTESRLFTSTQVYELGNQTPISSGSSIHVRTDVALSKTEAFEWKTAPMRSPRSE
jgi:hypothetical protein